VPLDKVGAGSTLLRVVVTSLALLNAAFLSGFLIWDSYALRVVQLFLTVTLLGDGITRAATSRAAGVRFRRIRWALFAVDGLVFLLWYAYGVYMTSISRPPRAAFEVNFAWDMLRTSPHTSTFWFWVVAVNAVFSAVVGFIGLASLVLPERRR